MALSYLAKVITRAMNLLELFDLIVIFLGHKLIQTQFSIHKDS